MKPLNHKIFNWRTLFIVIAAIAACWVLWLIFRGGVNAPSHKEEQKEIKQQQKDLRAADKAFIVDSAKWKKRGDSLEKELIVAHQQINRYRKELAAGAKKAKEITSTIQKAKLDKDTAGIVRACDSLQYLVEQQAGVISHYENQADSTFQMYGQIIAAKDSTINAQAALLSQMRTANLNYEEKYEELSKDYVRVSKKAKQGRTTERILAIGAIALAIVIPK